MGASFDPGLAAKAVVALLSANMTAKLASVQASSEYGDSITLDTIKTYYQAMPGVPDLWPWIAVHPSGPQDIHDQLSGFAMRGHRLDVAHAQIAMPALGSYTVLETMQKRLERTERSIEEVLQAGRTITVAGTNKASIDIIGPPIWLPYDSIGEGDQARVFRSVRLPIRVIAK